MMADQIINAIHENDLENFLNNIGILQKIKNGEVKCFFCGVIVTLENFHCVFPENDDIQICCEKLSCRTILKNKYLEKGD